MPADTRKDKYDYEKSHHSKEGSENARGTKRAIGETSSIKHNSSSSRKSVGLYSGNHQSPNSTLLRRSERAKFTPNSGNSTHTSHKRKRSVDELIIEANHVDQRGKPESNPCSQRKKTLPTHRYRDLFRAHTRKVNASEGVNPRASSEDLASETAGLASETMNGNVRESIVPIQQKEKVAEGMLVQEGLNNQTEKKESKYMKKIERSIRRLLDRQSNEEKELQKQWQERQAKLEKYFKLECTVIHSVFSSEAVRTDKLKISEANHRQKLDKLDSEMDTELKGMKARHQAEIEEEEKEGIRKMREWTENGLFDNLQSKEAVPITSSSLEEENADVIRRSAELHNDAAENSGSAEVAAVPITSGNGAISNSSNAIQINNEATTFENVGERTAASLGVHAESSGAANNVVEQSATSKTDQISAENSTLQTDADANEKEGTAASEQDNAARTEQIDEAISSTHIDSMNSPSTMNPSVIQPDTNQHQVNSFPVSQVNPTLQTEADANEEGTDQNDEANSCTHMESMDSPCTVTPSVVQPVRNQHQVDSLHVSQENATSCARLDQLNNEDVRAETSGIRNEMNQDITPSSDHCDGMPCNASDEAVYSYQFPEQAVPLDTGVPENQLMTESSLPPEARIQEDERPLSRWIEAPPPRPLDGSFNPFLHNLSQSDSYMASRSLLPSLSRELDDPLEREYERICGESNQVSKNHKDMVSRLKRECAKEIEEIVGQIRNKYESRVREAEASFIEKKKEVDRLKWKVGMNIKLAEAFRCKCIDHRTTPQQQQQQQQQAVAASTASLTRQQQQQLLHNSRQFSRRLAVRLPPISSVLPV